MQSIKKKMSVPVLLKSRVMQFVLLSIQLVFVTVGGFQFRMWNGDWQKDEVNFSGKEENSMFDGLAKQFGKLIQRGLERPPEKKEQLKRVPPLNHSDKCSDRSSNLQTILPPNYVPAVHTPLNGPLDTPEGNYQRNYQTIPPPGSQPLYSTQPPSLSSGGNSRFTPVEGRNHRQPRSANPYSTIIVTQTDKEVGNRSNQIDRGIQDLAPVVKQLRVGNAYHGTEKTEIKPLPKTEIRPLSNKTSESRLTYKQATSESSRLTYLPVSVEELEYLDERFIGPKHGANDCYGITCVPYICSGITSVLNPCTVPSHLSENFILDLWNQEKEALDVKFVVEDTVKHKGHWVLARQTMSMQPHDRDSVKLDTNSVKLNTDFVSTQPNQESVKPDASAQKGRFQRRLQRSPVVRERSPHYRPSTTMHMEIDEEVMNPDVSTRGLPGSPSVGVVPPRVFPSMRSPSGRPNGVLSSGSPQPNGMDSMNLVTTRMDMNLVTTNDMDVNLANDLANDMDTNNSPPGISWPRSSTPFYNGPPLTMLPAGFVNHGQETMIPLHMRNNPDIQRHLQAQELRIANEKYKIRPIGIIIHDDGHHNLEIEYQAEDPTNSVRWRFTPPDSNGIRRIKKEIGGVDLEKIFELEQVEWDSASSSKSCCMNETGHDKTGCSSLNLKSNLKSKYVGPTMLTVNEIDDLIMNKYSYNDSYNDSCFLTQNNYRSKYRAIMHWLALRFTYNGGLIDNRLVLVEEAFTSLWSIKGIYIPLDKNGILVHTELEGIPKMINSEPKTILFTIPNDEELEKPYYLSNSISNTMTAKKSLLKPYYLPTTITARTPGWTLTTCMLNELYDIFKPISDKASQLGEDLEYLV